MTLEEAMTAWCEAEARYHEVANNPNATDEELIQARREFSHAGNEWLRLQTSEVNA